MANTAFQSLFADADTADLFGDMMKLGSGISSFIGKSKEAEYKKKYQNYTNTMARLSSAINQDALTLNEIMYNVNSAEESKGIRLAGLSSVAAAEVSAAAAGVKGKSVSVSLNQLRGSAFNAEFRRQREFKYAMLGFDQQRTSSAMASAMRQDNSFIDSPNLISSVLGAF